MYIYIYIYKNLRIFRTLTYSSHIQNSLKDLIRSFFAKIVKYYNYFPKTLDLRSLTDF